MLVNRGRPARRGRCRLGVGIRGVDARVASEFLTFGDWRFDRQARLLYRLDGTASSMPVPIGSRAQAILMLLLEQPGALVAKDTILESVWPDTVVEANNLNVQIAALRRVLDAGRATGSYIQTVPGRGYRFAVPVSRTAETASALPRMSIVVLPFANLGGDPGDDDLAEAITQDLTIDLSRLPGMLVVAREPAYTGRGRTVDVRRVGEELGVRYALEGSLRNLGATLRVNAQLVATETGMHLWADRFDQHLDAPGAGQDAIVRRIVQTLNIALTDIEVARGKRERPTNPDSFDLILQAQSLVLHTMGPREHVERMALLERALQLDPTSIVAMMGLSDELINAMLNFGISRGDDLERAARLIADAAAINPNDPRVLAQIAYLMRAQERYTEALSAYRRVLDYDPNYNVAYKQIGKLLTYTGRAEEAVSMIEESIRRDPWSWDNWARCGELSWALLILGRDEEAIVWAHRALAANPSNVPFIFARFNLRLAAAHARLGQFNEAHRALAEVHRIWPYATVRSISPGDIPFSSVYGAQIERFQAALRLAGLRDHAEEAAECDVVPDGMLHADLAGLTPTTVPGATTIRTAELAVLIAERQPIVIDTLLFSWGWSIPGAIGLKYAGWGGSTSDRMQDRLRRKVQQLTQGDLAAPIVSVGFNSERFDGRNLALRLAALGCTQVYWYRGGREAWEVAGNPEDMVRSADW
jgi:adenylate cyclase